MSGPLHQESLGSLTPSQIVSELDKYIVGQKEAKRAVAIALRNRWRRQRVSPSIRDEIHPKNILMIGPTGVGKTEIARRLARLAKAPFVKVEATKYTEVGYVGKDVESMIRDLVDISVKMIQEEEMEKVRPRAKRAAQERLLDLLLPHSPTPPEPLDSAREIKIENTTREKFRVMLQEGQLSDREVELKVQQKSGGVDIFAIPGMEGMGTNIKDMMENLVPRRERVKKMKVKEALAVLEEEEAQKLVDMDRVIPKAIERAENHGIVFLDEMDKIADSSEQSKTGGVSREGVQRDLLPIVEGSSVGTKHGVVKTDHILFIAAGAFHQSKPSDLVPELQGRFPIRVELKSLTTEDFIRILTEPQNALPKQYTALMETEGVHLKFDSDAISALASLATGVNDKMENIGARRLHTILERVLDEISFSASDIAGQTVEITSDYVNKKITDLVTDTDLSRYIL